jgi:hypothetical protein
MKRRIFLWGLSNGIIALSIAALFWLGLGLGPSANKVEWFIDAFVMVVVYGSCGALVWGAIRLRRRSGFQRADLRPADPQQRLENSKTMHRFIWVVVIQTILVALAVVFSMRFASLDVLWSLIALIVSLHFIPLGKIFRVQAYYFVGAIGSVLAASSFLPFLAPFRMMYLGVALGIVMLCSAAFLLWKAEDLAPAAEGEAQDN